jgi:hypothetical protein
MASERKLAAIVAADVAGYSRLMAADEEGTLVRLKAHRRRALSGRNPARHARAQRRHPPADKRIDFRVDRASLRRTLSMALRILDRVR